MVAATPDIALLPGVELHYYLESKGAVEVSARTSLLHKTPAKVTKYGSGRGNQLLCDLRLHAPNCPRGPELPCLINQVLIAYLLSVRSQPAKY